MGRRRCGAPTATTSRFLARQIALYAGVAAEHAATLSSALGSPARRAL